MKPHNNSTRAVALLIASRNQYARLLRSVVNADADRDVNASRCRDVLCEVLRLSLTTDAAMIGDAGGDGIAAASVFQLVFAAIGDADWLWIIDHLPEAGR
jgi:hypothetical protein